MKLVRSLILFSLASLSTGHVSATGSRTVYVCDLESPQADTAPKKVHVSFQPASCKITDCEPATTDDASCEESLLLDKGKVLAPIELDMASVKTRETRKGSQQSFSWQQADTATGTLALDLKERSGFFTSSYYFESDIALTYRFKFRNCRPARQ